MADHGTLFEGLGERGRNVGGYTLEVDGAAVYGEGGGGVDVCVV